MHAMACLRLEERSLETQAQAIRQTFIVAARQGCRKQRNACWADHAIGVPCASRPAPARARTGSLEPALMTTRSSPSLDVPSRPTALSRSGPVTRIARVASGRSIYILHSVDLQRQAAPMRRSAMQPAASSQHVRAPEPAPPRTPRASDPSPGSAWPPGDV